MRVWVRYEYDMEYGDTKILEKLEYDRWVLIKYKIYFYPYFKNIIKHISILYQ